MGRRVAAALALAIGLLGHSTGGAQAGGGRLAPVRDRYDPGEVATLVGYTSGPAPEQPFYAYLRAAGGPAGGWYVGELAVQETGRGGWLGLRVTVRFEVPAEAEPGLYEVSYCDDPCTGALLGDVVDSPVSVGVGPVRPVIREWPLDEPEIANLAGDALLVGPGYARTAADVRSPPAPPPASAPAPVPAAPPVAVTVTVPVEVPVPVPATDDMAWPLPTALVLGAAAGTGLVLSWRERGARRAGPTPTRAPAPADRMTSAAAAGPG